MLTKLEVAEYVENIDGELIYLPNVVEVETNWLNKDVKTVTIKVPTKDAGDVYVMFSGNYSSWDGTEWNDATFVEPKEEKVLKYVPVELSNVSTVAVQKEKIINAIDEVDICFFDDLTEKGLADEVYELNLGDGNTLIRTFKIEMCNEVLFVQFEGTYSSWDGNEFYTAYLAEPYEFVGTRYREVNAKF